MKALCRNCNRSNMACTLYEGYKPLCTKCLKEITEKKKPKPKQCECPYCPEHNESFHSVLEEKNPPTIHGETIEG